jgi:translation initiation factor 1A
MDENQFGNEQEEGQQGMPIQRVRLPRGKEVLGVLEQRLGASRMMVKCFDGKTRTCRVPGRMKRKLWLREGDVVLVEPWEHQGDEKGDVIFKYTPTAADWLKRKGFIKIEEEF